MIWMIAGRGRGAAVAILVLLAMSTGVWLGSRARPEVVAAPLAPDQAVEARMAAAHVFLPVMTPIGPGCQPDLVVQNLGQEPSKAVLLTWQPPGFCPPQANGPLMAECSGLLAPGAAWTFTGPQVATGSISGALFSFSARRLTELGLQLPFDDVAANFMCERLYFGVVGDAPDYSSFLQAFRGGSDFAGIPMGRIVGGPIGAQWIERCSGAQPGTNALRPAQASAFSPESGGYLSFLPWVERDWTLYVQNLGADCAEAQAWFTGTHDQAKACGAMTIAPGESKRLLAADCLDQPAGMWVRASQPVAVMARLEKQDHWAVYGGQGAGGTMLHLELMDIATPLRIFAQNPSTTVTATVALRLRDAAGEHLLFNAAVVPPRHTAELRVAPADLGAAAGKPLSLLLESASQGTDPPAPVIAVAMPESAGHPGAIGRALSLEAGGRAKSGAALVGFPAIDRDETSVTGASRASRLLVHNSVDVPGFTDFGIYVYDQNGFMDVICDKLNQRQTAAIDLQAFGFMNAGFRGSALVSATFWEHDVFDPQGNFLRNVVALQGSVHEPGPIFSDLDVRQGLLGGGAEAGFAASPVLPACPPAIGPGQTPGRPVPTPTSMATPGPSRTPGQRPQEDSPDGRSAYLPTLNVDEWGNGSCIATVHLINLGVDPSKAVLVTWGEPGFCPPESAGPLKVECSGLVRPGAAWSFSGPMLPTGSQGGMVFSFTARQLSELGLAEQLGFDDVAADFMCETLFFGVVGDGDDYRRFKAAFDGGTTFAGIPLWKVKGGTLSVTVQRHCAFGPRAQHLDLRASYAAIPGWMPPTGRDASGVFQTVLTGLPGGPASPGGRSVTEISVQNTGLDCAQVDVWLATSVAWSPGKEGPPAGTACQPLRVCRQGLTIAPGEARRISLGDCTVAGETVAVILRGSQPLAAVADVSDGESLATVPGLPLAQRQWAMPLPAVAAGGRRILSLVNPDAGAPLRAELSQRPANASATLRRTVWVCPSGQLLLDLDDARLGLAADQGSLLRVATQDDDGRPTNRGLVAGLSIQTVADAAPAMALSPWGDDDRSLGASVLALPIGQRFAADPLAAAAKVHVANIVRQPGFTDVALYVYDANGLVDHLCERLEATTVHPIDLSRLGFLTPGFSGHLLVSAGHWEHPAGSGSNRIGLQAWATLAEGPDQSPALLEAWSAVTALGPDAYRALEGVAAQGLPPCPGSSAPTPSPGTPPKATDGRKAFLPALRSGD